MTRQSIVFLDRDGTLVQDLGWNNDPSSINLLAGTCRALRKLKKAGALLVLITNQSAVARGICTEEDVQLFHDELNKRLMKDGAALDAIHYCPHHPSEGRGPCTVLCECRKPAPGMILKACDDFNIAPTDCFVVGDSSSDTGAGRAAGCRTILIQKEAPDGLPDPDPDFPCSDLGTAADWILGRLEERE